MTDKTDQTIPRDLLAKYFGEDPRLVSAFEDSLIQTQENAEILDGQVTATTKMQDATVVTLSANEGLNNEFILSRGDGTRLAVTAGKLAIDVDDTVVRATQYSAKLIPPGHVTLFLPVDGTLISDSQPATLYAKTLDKPTLISPVIVHGLIDCDTDVDAAAAGVPIDGLYRDGNVVCVRRS